jgi:hypothetical protein
MRRVGYQNAVLTIIAVLLGLSLLERQTGTSVRPAQASAQPAFEGGMTSAIEQRKAMISELRSIGARLDRIDAKFKTGMDVNVKDMPPVKFPPEVLRRLEIRSEPLPGQAR